MASWGWDYSIVVHDFFLMQQSYLYSIGSFVDNRNHQNKQPKQLSFIRTNECQKKFLHWIFHNYVMLLPRINVFFSLCSLTHLDHIIRCDLRVICWTKRNENHKWQQTPNSFLGVKSALNSLHATPSKYQIGISARAVSIPIYKELWPILEK